MLHTYPRRELPKTWPRRLPYDLTSLLFIVRDTGLLGAAVDGSLQLVGVTRFSCLRLVRDRRRRPGAGKYAQWA